MLLECTEDNQLNEDLEQYTCRNSSSDMGQDLANEHGVQQDQTVQSFIEYNSLTIFIITF